MAALAIRDDLSPDELRRRARREHDGRVSARLIALANALEGWAGNGRPPGRDGPADAARLGSTATTRKG